VPIKVLLADDSDVMLNVIRRTLEEDNRLEVVGEALSFTQTVQMICDYKPSILVFDLHLREQRDLSPAFIKSQLSAVPHTLAISFSFDEDARALAESYGAECLLDKMNLYSNLIPTIVGCTTLALIH
jgi:DNA-binding NarL/FixJ family response regulator